jgi:hypothetical protein
MPQRWKNESSVPNSQAGQPEGPLIDRQQLELDVLRQHIARVAETRPGDLEAARDAIAALLGA